ncbi:hypothetical protein TorRG33x02_114740, partial [Trema orientale]
RIPVAKPATAAAGCLGVDGHVSHDAVDSARVDFLVEHRLGVEIVIWVSAAGAGVRLSQVHQFGIAIRIGARIELPWAVARRVGELRLDCGARLLRVLVVVVVVVVGQEAGAVVVENPKGEEQLGGFVERRRQFGEFTWIGELLGREEARISRGEQCGGLIVGLVGALARGSRLSGCDGEARVARFGEG